MAGQYGTGAKQEIPYARPNGVTGWGRADLSFMTSPPHYTPWFDDHTTGPATGSTINYTHALTRTPTSSPTTIPPPLKIYLPVVQGNR